MGIEVVCACVVKVSELVSVIKDDTEAKFYGNAKQAAKLITLLSFL